MSISTWLLSLTRQAGWHWSTPKSWLIFISKYSFWERNEKNHFIHLKEIFLKKKKFKSPWCNHNYTSWKQKQWFRGSPFSPEMHHHLHVKLIIKKILLKKLELRRFWCPTVRKWLIYITENKFLLYCVHIALTCRHLFWRKTLLKL